MRLLVTTLALALGLATPAPAAGQTRKTLKARKAGEKQKGPKFPAVALYHVNHRESMTYRPYDARGALRKAELLRFNRFMRDGSGKGGRVGKMHPRLATLFYRVARHYVSQGKRIEVISGYRPGAKNSRSPHRKGLAVDFRVKGVSNAALRDYLRKNYDKVGVGYYPNSVFVHFDVRQKSAFWIDYSGPGEEAEYSADPLADLKSGRAEEYRPPKAGSAADDADEKAGTGEDGPPPGVETAAPPRKAEPAPREENGAAEDKPAMAEPGPADKPAKVEPKPAVPEKKSPAKPDEKKPAPEKKPEAEKGAKAE
ncbi:MAG: DUF882 domain-containing protein [Deltaproteobacteria bacterium]|nr:DUF882 domain-containing protein [Deltaproteobacteria bacterium]